MREIKFRAYDKVNKCWVYFRLKKGAFSEISAPVPLENKKIIPTEEWQQFTGLIDKNNIEIFEGDIVELRIK